MPALQTGKQAMIILKQWIASPCVVVQMSIMWGASMKNLTGWLMSFGLDIKCVTNWRAVA